MKAIVITAALSSLVAIMPAGAEPTATKAPAESIEKSMDAPGKRSARTLYCYDMESTGSRITKRSCRTRADWKSVGVNVPANL